MGFDISRKLVKSPASGITVVALIFCLSTLWTVLAAPSRWHLTKASEALAPDSRLRRQMYAALDAAEKAGTDPRISHFNVRAATVVDVGGRENIVLGGNSEYEIPEAIHGETSVLNHVTALYGAEATRKKVRFIAFYAEHCGGGASCGDCRDYQLANTDYEHLLVVCGQSSDHTVHVSRFRDQLVCERDFPGVEARNIPLSTEELDRLVRAAEEARQGGVTLFTTDRHSGAAGLSFSGKTYRAAGGDDAAFHYRYPIGGLLQQAATGRDYFLRAIVVAGEPGKWPVVNYRDRQYGYEASTFNLQAGKAPIVLILTDGKGRFRMTTFDQALPHAFSTADFMPQAVKAFLQSHQTEPGK
jgi:cytidine deaminase